MERLDHRVLEAFRDLLGHLAGKAKWAELEQTEPGACLGKQDPRATGVLTASLGCLGRRASRVILAGWGSQAPLGKTAGRE